MGQTRQLLVLLKTCYGLTDGPFAWFEHLRKVLVEKLGYVQSKCEVCAFFLFDKDYNLTGTLGLATDDILHGGGKEHQQKMEWLRSTYKLGKFQFNSGRFAGKDIKLEADGNIMVQQGVLRGRTHPSNQIAPEQEFTKVFSMHLGRRGGVKGIDRCFSMARERDSGRH